MSSCGSLHQWEVSESRHWDEVDGMSLSLYLVLCDSSVDESIRMSALDLPASSALSGGS